MKLLLIPAALLLAACSSATKTSAADKCAAMPGDTVYTAFRPAFRECSVSSKARPIQPLAHADFSPTMTRGSRSGSCFSAELEFVVDESGLIELPTAHVIKTSNPQFADAVVAVLPAWRFEPAQKDGKPVRQITNYKSSVQSVTVVVPAGSPPPSRPPAGTRVPTTC